MTTPKTRAAIPPRGEPYCNAALKAAYDMQAGAKSFPPRHESPVHPDLQIDDLIAACQQFPDGDSSNHLRSAMNLRQLCRRLWDALTPGQRAELAKGARE